MKKFFVVAVGSFELKMVTEILKRNNKEFVTLKEDRASDQISKKIEKAIKQKKEIVMIGCEPEKGEWQRCYKNVPMRIVDYKTENEKEKSIIRKIEKILKEDILTDFDRMIAAGMEDYIPGMLDEAERLGMSYKQKEKTIKDIQRGRALFCDGITKEALKDAEKAVEARKEVNGLTVVEYNHENNRPVMDLLWNRYNNLFIKNKKQNKGVLFTPDYDLVQVVQGSGGETWTTRREDSTRYRVLSDHLTEMEGAIMRYFAIC